MEEDEAPLLPPRSPGVLSKEGSPARRPLSPVTNTVGSPVRSAESSPTRGGSPCARDRVNESRPAGVSSRGSADVQPCNASSSVSERKDTSEVPVTTKSSASKRKMAKPRKKRLFNNTIQLQESLLEPVTTTGSTTTVNDSVLGVAGVRVRKRPSRFNVSLVSGFTVEMPKQGVATPKRKRSNTAESDTDRATKRVKLDNSKETKRKTTSKEMNSKEKASKPNEITGKKSNKVKPKSSEAQAASVLEQKEEPGIFDKVTSSAKESERKVKPNHQQGVSVDILGVDVDSSFDNTEYLTSQSHLSKIWAKSNPTTQPSQIGCRKSKRLSALPVSVDASEVLPSWKVTSDPPRKQGDAVAPKGANVKPDGGEVLKTEKKVGIVKPSTRRSSMVPTASLTNGGASEEISEATAGESSKTTEMVKGRTERSAKLPRRKSVGVFPLSAKSEGESVSEETTVTKRDDSWEMPDRGKKARPVRRKSVAISSQLVSVEAQGVQSNTRSRRRSAFAFSPATFDSSVCERDESDSKVGTGNQNNSDDSVSATTNGEAAPMEKAVPEMSEKNRRSIGGSAQTVEKGPVKTTKSEAISKKCGVITETPDDKEDPKEGTHVQVEPFDNQPPDTRKKSFTTPKGPGALNTPSNRRRSMRIVAIANSVQKAGTPLSCVPSFNLTASTIEQAREKDTFTVNEISVAPVSNKCPADFDSTGDESFLSVTRKKKKRFPAGNRAPIADSSELNSSPGVSKNKASDLKETQTSKIQSGENFTKSNRSDHNVSRALSAASVRTNPSKSRRSVDEFVPSSASASARWKPKSPVNEQKQRLSTSDSGERKAVIPKRKTKAKPEKRVKPKKNQSDAVGERSSSGTEKKKDINSNILSNKPRSSSSSSTGLSSSTSEGGTRRKQASSSKFPNSIVLTSLHSE